MIQVEHYYCDLYNNSAVYTLPHYRWGWGHWPHLFTCTGFYRHSMAKHFTTYILYETVTTSVSELAPNIKTRQLFASYLTWHTVSEWMTTLSKTIKLYKCRCFLVLCLDSDQLQSFQWKDLLKLQIKNTCTGIFLYIYILVRPKYKGDKQFQKWQHLIQYSFSYDNVSLVTL